jgi:cytochrome c oxidase subunit 2
MNELFPFTAPASIAARQVDTAFYWILVIAVVTGALLLLLVIAFSIRYRRGSAARRGALPDILSKEVEIGWTTGTVFIFLFLFWWFVGGFEFPPRHVPNEMEIHVVAKQWMWKIEHPGGAREIDALHIPEGATIRLIMTSEDVIHSFYVPAFRIKQDVLPGRYTEIVLHPSRTGTFHLFCAEFCGTQHSHMTGFVTVMAPAAYAAWQNAQPKASTTVAEGEVLYATLGCAACHSVRSRVKAPKLEGLYGSTIALSDGRSAHVDEAYLRGAILHPGDLRVPGFAPAMPSYAGSIADTDMDALTDYLKSLSGGSSP